MTEAQFSDAALGLLLAGAVASWAYKKGALTGDGALAATLVGALVYAAGGAVWASVLVAFFAGSSALTNWRAGDKWTANADFSKGLRRDSGQVLANGAVAAAVALAFAISPQPALFAAYVGAVAAATADTWGTEIGLVSRQPPRLITTRLPVTPGTSGAVTSLGTAGAAAGSLFAAAVAAGAVAMAGLLTGGGLDLSGTRLMVIAPAAGMTGALVDSWLGATVQRVNRCPRCEKLTERAIHSCGTPARHVRGWRRLDGDGVNVVACLTGACVALVLDVLVFYP